jgi:hypothetical protein
MKLFEYAVLYVPKKKEKDEEAPPPKLIVPIKAVLTESEASATLLAARDIPQEYADKLEQCQVAVRPF